MPSPKSGSAGSAVCPKEPKIAEDADKVDPGEVDKVKAEQRQQKSGKYGSVKVQPHKPGESEEGESKKKAWIEIEMIDEADQPVPGMAYRITLPDDSVAEGTLDDKGLARIEGIEPGACRITFPSLDKEAWERA